MCCSVQDTLYNSSSKETGDYRGAVSSLGFLPAFKSRVYMSFLPAPSCLEGSGDVLGEDGEELGNGAERQCGGQS